MLCETKARIHQNTTLRNPKLTQAMIATQPFVVHPAASTRIAEVDFDNLIFGHSFADHMMVVDYVNGHWQTPVVMPYGPLELMPAMHSLHYGQLIFEGLKAYRQEDGSIAIFRPFANWARFNQSAERLCMPHVSEELFVQGIFELLKLDQEWVPNKPGSALYIRPFMMGTDGFIGIRPSATYKFIIFTCPVGAYYNEPIKLKLEKHYSRAAQGGTGSAKCAGNYAGALLPTKNAQAEGYNQLLWLDAAEHEYLEESGTMNVMLVKEGKVVTPKLTDSLLPGVTRDSVLTIARTLGYEVEERRIAAAEVTEGIESGAITEMFGVGTAATIAPIMSVGMEHKQHMLPAQTPEGFASKAKKYLDDIRYGRIADPFEWMLKV